MASTFDVYALSPEHEGLSIALGKPAVVTNVGGLSEVLTDGHQGILVPPARPDQMAAAIERLLADAALRARMGESGRERARDFDIRVAVTRMEQVYGELLT